MIKKILFLSTLSISVLSLSACESNVENDGNVDSNVEVETEEFGLVEMSKLEFLVEMNDIRKELWSKTNLETFKSTLNSAIKIFEDNYANLGYDDFFEFYNCDECDDDEVVELANYSVKIISVLSSTCDVLSDSDNQLHLFNFINAEEDSIEELNGYLVIARVFSPVASLLDMTERDALWEEIRTNTGCACALFNNAKYTVNENTKEITPVYDFITTLYEEDGETYTAEVTTIINFKEIVQTYLSNVDQSKF